jgi:hypothetical protein
MHGLMVMSFILEARKHCSRSDDKFLEDAAVSYAAARRALVSMVTAVASITAVVIAVDVFR